MKQIFNFFTALLVNNSDSGIKSNLPNTVNWLRALPFFLLNLSCLLVFYVGFSWTAFIVAAALYFVRVFSIGAFYHRYFSHRAFKTNRFWQFIFAILGASAVQRGPLWWATHHRQHHQVADEPEDQHSPIQHGFLWSHIGWFLSSRNYFYDPERVKDLARYPELVFLDRRDTLVPILLAMILFFVGMYLQHAHPELGTNGLQLFVWGFCLSTVAVFHTTVSINSIAHKYGKRRFNTKDHSRNSLFLALLTLGEGWHNNHHHYPATARQGFMWWEVDITYYVLKLLEKLYIISDLRGVPKEILEKNRI